MSLARRATAAKGKRSDFLLVRSSLFLFLFSFPHARCSIYRSSTNGRDMSTHTHARTANNIEPVKRSFSLFVSFSPSSSSSLVRAFDELVERWRSVKNAEPRLQQMMCHHPTWLVTAAHKVRMCVMTNRKSFRRRDADIHRWLLAVRYPSQTD